jgi:hypothetical protein
MRYGTSAPAKNKLVRPHLNKHVELLLSFPAEAIGLFTGFTFLDELPLIRMSLEVISSTFCVDPPAI